MAERRNERAGRPRSARSSRPGTGSTRPSSTRPASGRRPRNPAPSSATGPITGANSLDLLGDEDVFDEVTAVIDRVDDEKPAAEPEAAAPARRALAAEGRERRATAQALAARWKRLNPRRVIVLAVVLGVVSLTLAMPLRTYFSQRAELDQVRAANTAVERENADLTRKVNQQGDPAYVEAQARARLQMVRPGETPFVMELPGRERAAQERRRAAERAANPWYANLWDSVSTPPPAK